MLCIRDRCQTAPSCSAPRRDQTCRTHPCHSLPNQLCPVNTVFTISNPVQGSSSGHIVAMFCLSFCKCGVWFMHKQLVSIYTMSGSDQSRSHTRPLSGTSSGRSSSLICIVHSKLVGGTSYIHHALKQDKCMRICLSLSVQQSGICVWLCTLENDLIQVV